MKYGWLSICAAVGRVAGFSPNRSFSKEAPDEVRMGNFERIMLPVWFFEGGRRSVRAFGNRLKPGQVSSVGIPQSSNIYYTVNEQSI